jgi:hypothetical protein
MTGCKGLKKAALRGLLTLCTLTSLAAPVLAVDSGTAVYNQVAKFLPADDADAVTTDILDASAYYQVDPILIAALFTCESGFYEDAISPAGAIGIAQLMPGTAETLGVNPYNTRDNIFGGVAYLAQQLNEFGDYALAEAAYNAGPGAVWDAGGIPGYAETQDYVRSVEATRSAIWDENGGEITPYYDPEYDEGDYDDDSLLDVQTQYVGDVTPAEPASGLTEANSAQKEVVNEPAPEEEPETIRFYPPSVTPKVTIEKAKGPSMQDNPGIKAKPQPQNSQRK